jgi:hypothetical protein
MNATDGAQTRVGSRALQKHAPFHLNKNRVADALLAELYAEVIEGKPRTRSDTASSRRTTKTSPSSRVTAVSAHSDLAGLFDGSTSRYFYRIEALQEALAGYLGDEFEQVLEESDFQEGPRTLTEFLEAEQEFFDRVWLSDPFGIRIVGSPAIAADVSTPRRAIASPSRPSNESRRNGQT